MKAMLSLACILIGFLTVSAHSDRNWYGYGPGPFPFGFPGGGKFAWGWDFYDIDELADFFCSCWNKPCRLVTGSKTLGCPQTNKFLQCTGQVCANQTCPDNQVWNNTQNACAGCAPGMHVASNKRVCVCDRGTSFDPRTKTCVECPTDSVNEPDRCYCNLTKAYDYKANACKDCPQGSTLQRYQRCRCNSTQFWSENWACLNCPGEWLPKAQTGFRASKCTCSGTNQIFDRTTVACYTCPTGTTASGDNSSCKCPNRFQGFNMVSQKCECLKDYVADAAGTGCVRPAITTRTTTTSTARPGGNP